MSFAKLFGPCSDCSDTAFAYLFITHLLRDQTLSNLGSQWLSRAMSHLEAEQAQYLRQMDA